MQSPFRRGVCFPLLEPPHLSVTEAVLQDRLRNGRGILLFAKCRVKNPCDLIQGITCFPGNCPGAKCVGIKSN